MKNILLFLSLGILLSFSSLTQQYLDIKYPGRTTVTPVTPQVSLYACESAPTAYSLPLKNISPFNLSNLSFTFILPQGISYAGGFVGPVGSSISAPASDSIIVSLPTLDSLESITLKIDIVAGCGVYSFGSTGGIFDVGFRTQFTQISNSVVHNNYYTFSPLIVNYPILQVVEKSFVATTNINYNLTNPAIGDNVDREIKIKNGGTSRLDSVYFVSRYKSSIQVNSYPSVASPYPPVIISGNDRTQLITLSGLDFASVGNFDGFLDPGEEIIFRERILIKDCNNTTSYFSAAWGCGSIICQNETVENRIIFPASSPRLTASPFVDTNYCYGIPPSGSQRMGIQLYNTAPNPVDSAKDILVDVFQGVNGFSPNFYSVIDTSTIQVRIPSVGQIPYTIIQTSANNSSFCNAAGSNSVGRFLIQIDKIYFGQRVNISWRVSTCINSTCTNGNLSVYDWGYNVSYKNRCDYSFRITSGVGLTDKDMRHHLSIGSAPTQVLASSGLTTFNFDIVNSYFGFPSDHSTDYLRYNY